MKNLFYKAITEMNYKLYWYTLYSETYLHYFYTIVFVSSYG